LRGLPADVAACAHAVPVAEFPEAIYKVLAMPMEDARLAAAAKLVRSRFAWPEVLASTEAIVRSVTEEV
ncbi:MAG: hypothetical protein J5861_01860, partial [Desulfovibrio sp.]|nr:hypothetical protein [Desulfovibrio sp.]